jgi:hypothetical protein
MSEPTEFLIVQQLQAALLAISVATGYHHDLDALAVKLDPNQNVEALIGETALRPFIVLELTPDVFQYQAAMRTRLTLPITIHAIHDADTTDDEALLRTYLRLCADVEQALTQDISRGGRAVDTRILTRKLQALDGRQVWAMVDTEITVIRGYGVPNG